MTLSQCHFSDNDCWLDGLFVTWWTFPEVNFLVKKIMRWRINHLCVNRHFIDDIQFLSCSLL